MPPILCPSRNPFDPSPWSLALSIRKVCARPRVWKAKTFYENYYPSLADLLRRRLFLYRSPRLDNITGMWNCKSLRFLAIYLYYPDLDLFNHKYHNLDTWSMIGLRPVWYHKPTGEINNKFYQAMRWQINADLNVKPWVPRDNLREIRKHSA